MSLFEVGVLVALGLIYLSLQNAKAKIEPLHDTVRQLGGIYSLIYDIERQTKFLASKDGPYVGRIEDSLCNIERQLDGTNSYSLAKSMEERFRKIEYSLDSMSSELSELRGIGATLDRIESNTFNGRLSGDDDF